MNNSKHYSSRQRLPAFLLFLVTISLFGSVTTLVLAFGTQSTDGLVWRKPLIGSLFMLICLTGIVAAFNPRECSGPAHARKPQTAAHATADTTSIHKASREFKGHHPDCGRYVAHTITSGSRVLCAACLGLLVGASIVLVWASLYFFVIPEMSYVNWWAVVSGQVGIVLGLAQLKFKGCARSAANVVFVVGSFLTLSGIDNLLHNFYADLYVLALIVFWLFTRISTSQWDHSKTCRECGLPCRI